MRSSSRNKKTKAVKRRPRKYEEFITIVLLHDQTINRMKRHSPTLFIDVGEQKLIDKQISAINKKFTNYELIISVGSSTSSVYSYIMDKYKNSTIRIVENKEYEDTNSCESARLCLHNTFNDKILFIDGSLLFEPKIFTGLDFSNSFAIINEYSDESLEIGVNANEESIEFFCYGANQPWSEIIFFNGKKTILDLEKILSDKSFRKKFLFEAVNKMTPKHNIKPKSNTGPVMKIKNIKTYNKVRSKYEVRN